MKQKVRFISAAFTFSVLFLIYSCNKGNQMETGNMMVTTVVQTMVAKYLDGQIKYSNAIMAQKLNSIKQNLEMGKLRTERLTDSSEIVLVPLAGTFFSQNNKGKATSTNLMLIFVNSQKVTMQNIVQYVPDNANETKEVPVGTFAKQLCGHTNQLAFNGGAIFSYARRSSRMGNFYQKWQTDRVCNRH